MTASRVMSEGRLLQYDRPAVLLTRPADPFVARMTGLADRAMRLLSLTTAGEAAVPGACRGTAGAGLRDLREALSEMLWCGADAAQVHGRGRHAARLAHAWTSILAHGRPG